MYEQNRPMQPSTGAVDISSAGAVSDVADVADVSSTGVVVAEAELVDGYTTGPV